MTILAPVRTAVKKVITAQLVSGRFPVTSFRFAATTGREAFVLMCLWNRPTRLVSMLTQFDEQDHPEGVRLFLWNNNRRDHRIYREALDAYSGGHGSLRRVDYVRSPFNLGSIARFFWARKIAKHDPRKPVIVIDDDQNVESTFVSEALAHYDPGAVTAWWAWTVLTSYYQRLPASVGDRVDHIGPGGMVCSSAVFANRDFFTGIPEKYAFLDDIWLSHYAQTRGYRLAKLPVNIEFVMNETNQYFNLESLKPEFHAYLHPSVG